MGNKDSRLKDGIRKTKYIFKEKNKRKSKQYGKRKKQQLNSTDMNNENENTENFDPNIQQRTANTLSPFATKKISEIKTPKRPSPVSDQGGNQNYHMESWSEQKGTPVHATQQQYDFGDYESDFDNRATRQNTDDIWNNTPQPTSNGQTLEEKERTSPESVVIQRNPGELLLELLPYCGQGDEHVDKLVIDVIRSADFDLNEVQDSFGNTVLILGCMYSQERIVAEAIRKGVDVRTKNISGATALHFGAYHESYSYEICKLLLSRGADPNAIENEYGCTPLHYAVGSSVDLVRLMLQKGGKNAVHIRDAGGYTPLEYCEANSEVYLELQASLDYSPNSKTAKSFIQDVETFLNSEHSDEQDDGTPSTQKNPGIDDKEHAELRRKLFEEETKAEEREKELQTLMDNRLAEQRKKYLLRLFRAHAKRVGLHQMLSNARFEASHLYFAKHKELVAQQEHQRSESSKQEAEAAELLYNAREEIEVLRNSIRKKDRTLDSLQIQLKNKEEKLANMMTMKSEYDKMASQINELTIATDEMTARNEKLAQELSEESRKRRKLHNEVEELKGKIRVYARVRPISNTEKENNYENSISYGTDRELFITTKRQTATGNVSSSEKKFSFDKVFPPTKDQSDVFVHVKDLVQSVVDGRKVLLMAYGQTGSGKTYTMIGPKENLGIGPRAIDFLYQCMEDHRAQFEYKVSAQIVELHIDSFRDLLSKKGKKQVTVSRSKNGDVKFEGLTVRRNLRNPSEMIQLFEEAQKNRKTSSTNMNQESSRSHLIFTIHVHSRDRATGVVTFGKLDIVDLAGCERRKKTGGSEKQLKEGTAINKGLTALGDVIGALAKNSSHVPFRNHPLTQALSESLRSRVLMFVNVSPADYNANESLNALNFAQRCNTVCTNVRGAGKNSSSSSQLAKNLQKELARQKAMGKKKSAPKSTTTLKSPVARMKLHTGF
eukprot:g3791.t1